MRKVVPAAMYSSPGLPTRSETWVAGAESGFPAPARRILAVQTQRIGDVLCFTPFLTALRRRFPRARLTALVQPPGDQLLRANPDLDNLLVYDPAAARGRPVALGFLVRQLRQERFEWAFSIHAASSVSLALRLAGIPRRTCAWRFGRPPAWGRRYTQSILQHRERGECHEVEYNLDLLRALGIQPEHEGYRITVLPDAAARATRVLRAAGIGPGAPFVVLHPGHAGGRLEWPPGYFARVADRIVEDLGIPVALTGSAAEAPLAERVRGAMDNRASLLAGRLTLPELAAALRAARLYVGVSTGPMHLAAAVGTPVVSLYGPEELIPERTRFCPYSVQGGRPSGQRFRPESNSNSNSSSNSAVARSAVTRHAARPTPPASPIQNPKSKIQNLEVFSPSPCDCPRMRECARGTCMRAIKPDTVFAAVRTLLEETATPVAELAAS